MPINNYMFLTGLPCLQTVELFTRIEQQLKRPNLKNTTIMLKNKRDDQCTRFFMNTRIVADLVKDGRHGDMLDCLKAASEKGTCCWQQIMACLAAMLHGEHANPLASTAAYALMPHLLKDSTMLSYFLQCNKMAAGDRNIWGSGLCRAIRKWYTSLSPAQLLLEFWHRPRSYSWSHRDIIKMVHLKKDLCLGSKVIIQYLFSNLEKTKVIFAGETEAAEYINWLEVIYNEDDAEVTNRLVMLAKLNGGVYKTSRVQDPIFIKPTDLTTLIPHLAEETVLKLVQEYNFYSKITPCKPRDSLEPQAEDEEHTHTSKAILLPSAQMTLNVTILQDRLKNEDIPDSISPIQWIMALNNFQYRIGNFIENEQHRNKWRSGSAVAMVGEQRCSRCPLPGYLKELVLQLEQVFMDSIKVTLSCACEALSCKTIVYRHYRHVML